METFSTALQYRVGVGLRFYALRPPLATSQTTVLAAFSTRGDSPVSAGPERYLAQISRQPTVKPGAARPTYPIVNYHLSFRGIWPQLTVVYFRNARSSTFGSSILKVAYGIDVDDKGDKILEVIDLSMEGVAEGLTPGAFMVEYLPFLQYIPEWVPGAGFQKRFRRWRDASHAMVDMPYERAKSAVVSFKLLIEVVHQNSSPTQKNGSSVSSLVGSILKRFKETGEKMSDDDEQVVKNVAAISYAGMCSLSPRSV